MIYNHWQHIITLTQSVQHYRKEKIKIRTWAQEIYPLIGKQRKCDTSKVCYIFSIHQIGILFIFNTTNWKQPIPRLSGTKMEINFQKLFPHISVWWLLYLALNSRYSNNCISYFSHRYSQTLVPYSSPQVKMPWAACMQYLWSFKSSRTKLQSNEQHLTRITWCFRNTEKSSRCTVSFL